MMDLLDILASLGMDAEKSALSNSLQRTEAEHSEYERQRAAYLAGTEQIEQAAAASRARFDELEAMLRETHSMVSELYARLIPKEG